MVFQLEDDPAHPFQGDIYFDIALSEDRKLLNYLCIQRRLPFFILDRMHILRGTKYIHWHEEHRRRARMGLVKALVHMEDISERYSFNDAKAAFQSKYPLNQLLGFLDAF